MEVIKSKIANALTSAAVDHVVASTSDIYDEKQGKYQEELNDIYGTIEDNPEWLYVCIDDDRRFLWGIRVDGSIEWSKGIPTPVQEELTRLENNINELVGGNLSEAIDNIQEILSFLEGVHDDETLLGKLSELNDRIDSANGDITALSERLAVVEEKTEELSHEDNPEFINVITDSEGKILEGIKEDGTKYFANKIQQGGNLSEIIDNPEYLFVYTDGTDRPLFGIKTDGSIEFAKGIPTPIKNELDKLENILNTLTGENLSNAIENIQEVLSFLEGFEDNEKLIEKLNLINENISVLEEKTEELNHIDNPEYLKVIVDNENRLIAAIRNDGTPYFPKNELLNIISNEEYIYAIVDASNHFLWGINYEGNIIKSDNRFENEVQNIYDELKQFILELVKISSVIENPEYLSIVIDSEDKILEYIDTNGKKHFSYQEMYDVSDNPEFIKVLIDDKNRIIKSISIDNEETINIKTTFNQSVDFKENVSINNININKNLNLSKTALSEFEQILRNDGFSSSVNLSDFESLPLPRPKKASKVNFIVSELPTLDSHIFSGFMEYYDYNGNYFKKPIDIKIQGQTSRGYARYGGMANFSVDITDGSEIIFGDWVAQDSFHFKGFADDVTKARADSAYKIYDILLNYLDAYPNRVLKKEESLITQNKASGDFFTDYGDGALCHPDGFPVELYHNGNYHGLYLLNLKKHRKNYTMKKDDYTSILIDPDTGMINFWGGISQNYERMEFRNPKTMISMAGTEIDYNVSPFPELIDESSDYWPFDVVSGDTIIKEAYIPSRKIDESDKDYTKRIDKYKNNCSNTRISKRIVWGYNENGVRHLGWSEKYQEVLNSMYEIAENGTYKKIDGTYSVWTSSDGDVTRYNIKEDLSTSKTLFEQYFDKPACEALLLLQVIIKNSDCVNKNTLWGTYNNGKIAPFAYDLDESFGANVLSVKSAGSYHTNYINSDDGYFLKNNWPIQLLWRLYKDEIKSHYATMRELNILSPNSIKNIISSYTDAIGNAAYKRYIDFWKPAGYREDLTNTEYWTPLSIVANDAYPFWEEGTIANKDDIYKIGLGIGYTSYSMQYKSKVDNNTHCPVTSFYDKFPIVGGWFESRERIYKWIDSAFNIMDNTFSYNQ